MHWGIPCILGFSVGTHVSQWSGQDMISLATGTKTLTEFDDIDLVRD